MAATHKSRRIQALLIGLAVAIVLAFAYTVYLQQQAPDEPVLHDDQGQVLQLTNIQLDNNNTLIESLNKSQVNYILFTGSWCPHCKIVRNFISDHQLEDKIASDFFVFAEKEDPQTLQAYFPAVPTYLDNNWQLFDETGLEHIPALIKVNSKGELLERMEGETAITSYLSKLYGIDNASTQS